MICCALLLHFYQPPTQSLDVLHRVVKESYRPLLKVMGSLQERVCTATVSEVVDLFPAGPEVTLRASSWSTTPHDLAESNPYPLRRVHQAQRWAQGSQGRLLAQRSRALMDAGLHCCQYWWASRRPMWDVNMVQRGFALQQQAIPNACMALTQVATPPQRRMEAELLRASSERLYPQILQELLSP